MKLILYFIFLIISTKESKIEIIELSNYESKEIKFTKSKNYHIFKFNYNPIPNVNYTSCTIRLNPPNKIYHYFIYDNAGDILEENGFFKHYTNKNTKLDSQVGVILLEKRNKDLYIVLQYNNILLSNIRMFSNDSLYNINETFFYDYYYLQNINYIFYIPTNYSKYIKVGGNILFTGASISLSISEDNMNNTIKTISNTYFENFIELKQNHSYYFNFTLLSLQTRTKGVFLYLMKSNYSFIVDIQKGKKEFDLIPIIKDSYLLLDISSIKKGKYLVFEYDSNWYSMTSMLFKAEGYNSYDIDLNDYLNKSKRTTLNITHEKCHFNICIDGIEKKSDDLKKVIFKIPQAQKGIYYIQFRYGVRSIIPPSHVIYSCLLSLILALPNLIMFSIRKKNN